MSTPFVPIPMHVPQAFHRVSILFCLSAILRFARIPALLLASNHCHRFPRAGTHINMNLLWRAIFFLLHSAILEPVLIFFYHSDY